MARTHPSVRATGDAASLSVYLLHMASLLIFMSLCACASSVYAAGKLPRFASLASDEVNLRTGPGTRYPIRWVYHRKGLPVEIIDEYGNWRQLRDPDGETGWVHYGLLTGRRTALIQQDSATLHRNPDATSPAVLLAKPMVIARLLRCNPAWCYLEIKSHMGWMPKSAFWGAYKEEKF